MVEVTREFLQALERKLADDGLLIEAGWVGMRLAVIPLTAPQLQIAEMRTAFFAGAQHLFGNMMSIMEEGAEPTEADMRRVDLIDAELRRFLDDFKRQHNVKDH